MQSFPCGKACLQAGTIAILQTYNSVTQTCAQTYYSAISAESNQQRTRMPTKATKPEEEASSLYWWLYAELMERRRRLFRDIGRHTTIDNRKTLF